MIKKIIFMLFISTLINSCSINTKNMHSKTKIFIENKESQNDEAKTLEQNEKETLINELPLGEFITISSPTMNMKRETVNSITFSEEEVIENHDEKYLANSNIYPKISNNEYINLNNIVETSSIYFKNVMDLESIYMLDRRTFENIYFDQVEDLERIKTNLDIMFNHLQDFKIGMLIEILRQYVLGNNYYLAPLLENTEAENFIQIYLKVKEPYLKIYDLIETFNIYIIVSKSGFFIEQINYEDSTPYRRRLKKSLCVSNIINHTSNTFNINTWKYLEQIGLKKNVLKNIKHSCSLIFEDKIKKYKHRGSTYMSHRIIKYLGVFNYKGYKNIYIYHDSDKEATLPLFTTKEKNNDDLDPFGCYLSCLHLKSNYKNIILNKINSSFYIIEHRSFSNMNYPESVISNIKAIHLLKVNIPIDKWKVFLYLTSLFLLIFLPIILIKTQ